MSNTLDNFSQNHDNIHHGSLNYGRKLMKSQYRRNAGFVALAIVVVIAIIAILYMVQFGGVMGIDADSGFDKYSPQPWFHQDRLLRAEDFPIAQTGSGGKTVVEGNLLLAGTVTREDTDRGMISLTIDSAGAVKGKLQCRYSYPGSSYSIDAQFKGNIDPTIIYKDADGKHKEPLYLIAKGKYQQIKTNTKTGTATTYTETVYVVGWIENDFSTFGSVFLMTGDDEKSNTEYKWAAEQD